jgi:hypothetical protein
MHLNQGNLALSEQFADAGHELLNISGLARHDATAKNALFDALLALLSVKIRLGKMDEAAGLLHRAGELKPDVVADLGEYQQRQVKYFRNAARYHELRGNFVDAMRFSN